ncbi:hypothetical protein B0A48_09360 [Cryoendolithus antarcticus]|uniref:Uncharacterized protein n=1 Tax=Cryoendolithus antarcticus TaxID=1507870 RepID=A0A1V8SZQ1_9PEZI|nr:hypothetical protein B0A48_09360 [Cryoendolithus antarcticus]
MRGKRIACALRKMSAITEDAKRLAMSLRMKKAADFENEKWLKNQPNDVDEAAVLPSAKVFGTAELLVLILIEVARPWKVPEGSTWAEVQRWSALTGMRTLLLAQKVGKVWRNTIKESGQLQRLLFLEPAKCEPVSYIDWHLDSLKHYKDPLKSSFDEESGPVYGPEGQILVRKYRAHWGEYRDDAGRHHVFANPLLMHAFDFLKPDGLYSGEHELNLPYTFHHEEASWKKMLISQPPIKTLLIRHEHRVDGSIKGWGLTLIRSRGRDAATRPRLAAGYTIGMDGLSTLSSLGSRARDRQWLDGMEQWEQWNGVESLRKIEDVGKAVAEEKIEGEKKREEERK